MRKTAILAATFSVALLAATVHAGEDPKAAAEGASKKAADFLKSQANEDGTFGKSEARVVPGIVGLALNALVTSPGVKADDPAVQKAAAYLVGLQQNDGAIAIPRMGNENYNTSIAAVALKALNDPKHKDVLEKCKKYIEGCQLDGDLGYKSDEHYQAYGGFGYGSAKRADLSNTAFSLEALKALGVPEDSEAYKNAIVFIRRCQDNSETNDAPNMKGGENSGGMVYLPGDSEFGTIKTRDGKEVPKPYGNMTYQGMRSLIYCGLKADSPELQACWKWIKNNYAADKNPGGKGSEGYYYYVVAFAKAFTAAGQKEFQTADGKTVNWAKDLAAHLVSLQKEDGSWANGDKRWMESDSILATSYALIALNLCNEAMK
ncbi:MAG: terpene cyclase/mutase family protein [Planctomycetes bacterium]|nr:terpene cyclase/mutase family protein [Planctomycetota bacterium]